MSPLFILAILDNQQVCPIDFQGGINIAIGDISKDDKTKEECV